jgi:hypothetical protein
VWGDLNYIFLDKSALDQYVTNVKESLHEGLPVFTCCHVGNTSCRADIHDLSQIGFCVRLASFEATKQRDYFFFSSLSENWRTVGLILVAFHIERP